MMVLSEDYSKLTLFNEDCCVYINVFRVFFLVSFFVFIDTHAMMHVFVDNVIIFDLSTQIILNCDCAFEMCDQTTKATHCYITVAMAAVAAPSFFYQQILKYIF